MLLVSKENCDGKAMLALSPKGSQSMPVSKSCVMEGYAPWVVWAGCVGSA